MDDEPLRPPDLQTTAAWKAFFEAASAATALDLSGRAHDAIMPLVARLPRLRALDLSWSEVSDAGIAHLAGLEALERVDMLGTWTGDAAVEA